MVFTFDEKFLNYALCIMMQIKVHHGTLSRMQSVVLLLLPRYDPICSNIKKYSIKMNRYNQRIMSYHPIINFIGRGLHSLRENGVTASTKATNEKAYQVCLGKQHKKIFAVVIVNWRLEITIAGFLERCSLSQCLVLQARQHWIDSTQPVGM